MERAQAAASHPALLPLGTVVGRWRIVAWGGRGVYGAIYRAVRAEVEHAALAGSVALKLALLPKDPRFAREVEMLSCLRHPSIPRLWDHGEWQHPSSSLHPYIVMDWVDGVQLYDWARQQAATGQQVFRGLAQLASALKAVHAQGAVHRDVKGDNILVRRSDGRAILTDFGSSLPPDTALLTPQRLIPGTPAYHSPEAALFPLRFGRDATARYSAGPADDLYALGVTAYRLVTGKYPELGEPSKDAAGTWHPGELGSPPPHVVNPRVEPQLSAWIVRMLSARPEERGTLAQLLDGLEEAAQRSGSESTQPLFDVEATPSTPLSGAAVSVRVHTRSWRPWLAMAAAGVMLVSWAWWAALQGSVGKSLIAHGKAVSASQQDGGTAGLGDAMSVASMEDSPHPVVPDAMTEEAPPEPLPGQTRPDAKGRCPHKRQVALNGGCWVPLERDECEVFGGQLFKDRCYVPVVRRSRQPNASPPRKQ